MSEFCKECYINEFGEFVKKNEKIIMSNNVDLCEDCGKVKPVVIKVRKKRFWEK